MQLKNEKQLLTFSYDFARDGGAIGSIVLSKNITGLKAGMVVTDILVKAKEALNSSGTPTVVIGVDGDTDAFLANSYASLDAEGDVVRNNDLAVSLASDEDLLMTVGTAALNAGVLEVYLEVVSY